MKPSTYVPISFEQVTSTATDDIQAATVPNGCSAMLISVETTNARVTFEGTDPADTAGHVFLKDLEPVLVRLGQGATVKVASTAAADAVVDITYLQ